MRILALECSSVSASVAVCEDGKIIGSDFVRNGLTHSQTLMPMLERVVRDSGTDISSIDVFACTSGPGSFTGVRIGVAAVEGLADALAKPCFAVSSLEAAAFPYRDSGKTVCAVMDARCNQVYTASFYGSERLCDDEAILIPELKERLLRAKNGVILTGDGTQLVYNALKDEIAGLTASDENCRYADAKSVSIIAYERIMRGEPTVNSAELLPLYLRVPQAQRELNKKNNLKGDSNI